MRIEDFRITRFQFAHSRIIGDAQSRANEANVAALELVTDRGSIGLGFVQTGGTPLPDEVELERLFKCEAWSNLEGQTPAGLCHRVDGRRARCKGEMVGLFQDAISVALWDLAAKQVELPLHRLLGAKRNRVQAYASGLDFHLSDDEFSEFFSHADSLGFTAFKIQIGHQDFERDLHRLDLLSKAVRPRAHFIVDANEAWGLKEASIKLHSINLAGYDLLWAEDPVSMNDHESLRQLKNGIAFTSISSGGALSSHEQRQLLAAGALDVLNMSGPVSDAMRIGWLAAETGIPVNLENTTLETGVHVACALPNAEWKEYSFQNFDHLVEQPIEIRDGWAIAPDRPGHGLVLSKNARDVWRRPTALSSIPVAQARQNSI